MRTHKSAMDKVRSNMTDKEKRASMCQQRKNRNEQKKKDNIEREEKRTKYTPEQQLVRLDNRLGVGVGAKKERARIKKT